MIAISNKKLNILSTVIITITVIINIVAFFILPDQMLVQIDQSHTLPKLIVLPLVPILQFFMATVSREKHGSFVNMIALIILLVVDLAVIAMNLM